ncbi:RNA polymerase sigma factor FliA [Candidatus Magnetaquicoccaceae bacterium FCR-1]|uniref:RNA polymerase sigma factor FliA n=1 Tax=Candidatus Magnetaquiglobus chichijimensis TaxID=3141448 RepID=A0ABQ0CA51_9PROT
MVAAVTQKRAESPKDPADNDQGATWEGLSRDEVILKYAPIVKYVASRISMKLPQSVDIDDLVQVGILGLIDAVSKFDPHRGIKFQTYAEFRVRGAILDELRSMDWVPRAVRQTAAHIQETYLLLEGQMGKSVEDQEVAAHLGLTLDEFYRNLDAVRGIAILSFDDLRPSLDEEEWDVLEMLADPEIIDPVESIGLQQLRLALSEAISSLPDKERLVVTLYYFEELTMSEIGEVLGLTESRISQLHSKAAMRMRARMKRVLGRIS